MAGLMDFISDPVAMAQINERYQIVERVAAQMGCSPLEARNQMEYWDRVALETFHVGNTVDRKTLH